MPKYSLKTILATFTKANGKKRILFNKAPIGGLSSLVVAFVLYSLPFILFGIIFKTSLFTTLGIATSIILFIISSSIIMITVFIVAIITNNKVLMLITPSWNEYFNDVNIRLVLASTKTPYSDFFEYYEKVADKELSEEELHKYLLESFKKMQEDNKDLIEAMKKDNKLN